MFIFFFFQAEDGIRDWSVTGVQTCALPIWVRGGLDDASCGGELAAHGRGAEPSRRCCTYRAAFTSLRRSSRSGSEPERIGDARSEERRVGKEGRYRGVGDEL